MWQCESIKLLRKVTSSNTVERKKKKIRFSFYFFLIDRKSVSTVELYLTFFLDIFLKSTIILCIKSLTLDKIFVLENKF